MFQRLSASIVLSILLNTSFAQNIITVDAGKVLTTIPSTIYGSCMEDVNHEIYGGLYDQKIMGESFEEPASGLNYGEWKKYSGYWAADKEYGDNSISIIPGRHTKRMIAKNELGVEEDETAKLIYDPINFTDGMVEADIRFLISKGNGASVLIKVSDAGVGENIYSGYEIRLSRSDKKIKLIKHQNNYQLLAEENASFIPDQWNHLSIQTSSSNIKVYINHATTPTIDFNDPSPLTNGKIGLATARSPVSFRNVKIAANNQTTTLQLTYPVHQQVSDRWDVIQANDLQAKFTLLQQNAFNGITAQCIELINETGKAGIANRSLNRWGIAVEKGERFNGACYLRNENGSMTVTVALESADGKTTYASQTITSANNTWEKHSFALTSNTTDTNARFALYIQQKGKLYVDQVSLFSTGAKQFHGLPLRRDIGDALVNEGLTFMRYAGSMVNADGYRFKKMIGERNQRPPYTGHWNEYTTNGFGIEDFLQFAEAAHITPLFAINIEETPEDMADMVEYLNGDTTTIQGKQRAANGHPKPYGVQYIEIGNEEVLFEGDDAGMHAHYVERFNLLYNAMHAKDTSLKLVCSVWWRPESPNTEKTFKALDGKAAYWDYHVWADDKNAGINVDTSLTRMQQLFHQWSPNTTMKCAILEENGGLHNMQRALGHATILNAVRKHGDFVLTTVPANALQPWHQNDNGWDQGQIFFTPGKVWGMPPFYAQQMAAANHLPQLVQSSTTEAINVTATRSEDGKLLVLHIVNTDSTAQQATITINNFTKRKKQVQASMLSGALNAENIPGNPEAIATKTTVTDLPNTGNCGYTFAPLSYTILRFQQQ